MNLTHHKGWLPKPEADAFLAQARNLAWTQKDILLFGKRVPQPRLTVSLGRAYTYSGLAHPETPMPDWLTALLDRVRDLTGVAFNSVLGNLYRDGKDSIGWHADDETGLGPDPVVASLSFGGTRVFQTRPTRDRTPITSTPLGHGDLLIMPAGFQARFQHALPKSSKPTQERISLTLRRL